MSRTALTSTPTVEWTRNAMELNNTGVRLLEKGHITKAIRTFKTLTMALARRDRDRDTLSQNMTQANKTGSLLQAEEGKARLVHVMPVDDNDYAAQNAASYYGSSSSVAFPLRILHQDIDLASSSVYVMSVALYNHGVAVQCRFANHRCQAEALASAEKSLRTAKMLLWQSRDQLIGALNADDTYRWDNALSLINNALQQVFCEQDLFINREQDSDKKKGRVSILRPVVAMFSKTASRKTQVRALAA